MVVPMVDIIKVIHCCWQIAEIGQIGCCWQIGCTTGCELWIELWTQWIGIVVSWMTLRSVNVDIHSIFSRWHVNNSRFAVTDRQCCWIGQAKHKHRRDAVQTYINSFFHEWRSLEEGITEQVSAICIVLMYSNAFYFVCQDNNVGLQCQSLVGTSEGFWLEMLLEINWRLNTYKSKPMNHECQLYSTRSSWAANSARTNDQVRNVEQTDVHKETSAYYEQSNS